MQRRHFIAALAALSARPAFAEVPALKFRDLYVRGRELTPGAIALDGRRVRMTGYMAPPLKPEIDFFILTRLPMSVCPFCETEAQWPTDIVLARASRPVEVVRYTDLIRVEGVFRTGFETDPETGFTSFLRLEDITYDKL